MEQRLSSPPILPRRDSLVQGERQKCFTVELNGIKKWQSIKSAVHSAPKLISLTIFFPLFASQTFICILCNHLSFEVFFLLLYFFDEANFTLMRAHQCNRLNGNVEKTVFHYVLEFRIDFRDGKVLIIEVFTKLSSWGLFVSCVT